MLYRVMGKYKSGKRAWLLDLVKKSYEAGKRVFVLVPEQVTAQSEREILSLCGNGASELVEVTNFSRLSNIVLRSYGSLARRGVTEEEKKLILASTLKERQSVLSRLSLSRTPEGVDALYGELEEMRLAGLDASAAADLTEKELISPALAEKLEGLFLLRASFENALASRFDDPAEEELRLARILEEYPFFREAVVVVDGFWDFTAPQELLLKRLLTQAETVGISFLVDFENGAVFGKTIATARKILSLAKSVSCPVEDVRLEAPLEEGELAFLRDHLVTPAAPWRHPAKHIAITECQNPESECTYVAHTIAKMIREGASFRDFAVLSPAGEEFTLLASALEEAGIPYFLEKKESLAASNLAKTLLYAARIASGDTREEVVRAYLSYGIFLQNEEENFLLEKYIATWAPSKSLLFSDKPFVMNPEGYQEMHGAQKEELDKVNRAKMRVFTPLRHLSLALSQGKNEEKVAALVAFLEKIGTEQILFSEMKEAQEKGDSEETLRLLGMWNTVLERLSGLGRALGEETSSPEEFLTLLTLALAGTLPGSIPPGQDRVQLGVLGFMRPHQTKHLFLMGFGADAFSGNAKKGAVLTEAEREVLFEYGFPLSSGEKAQEEETFFFYLATCFARENLFLSFVGSPGEKDASSLSVFGKRIKILFPLLSLTKFVPEEAAPVTGEEAFRFLLENAGSDHPLQKALETRFAGRDGDREKLLLLLSGKAFAATEPSLQEEKPFDGIPMRLSFSTLERYTECPFSYFARYLLRAKETPSASFGANIAGSFIHRVLEKILVQLTLEKKSISSLTEKELKERNNLACDEAFAELAKEMPQDPSLALLVGRLKRSSLLILKQLAREFEVSKFVPLFFEKDLDEAGGYSLPLSDGTSLSFSGKIDRVDVYTDPKGRDFVRVVDYKTGSHSFSLEDVANGLDMQMLLYLYALWGKTLREGASPAEPAGVLYLNGMEKAQACDSREDLEAIQNTPFSSLSREGLLVNDETLLSAADPKGMGEFIPVHWKQGKMKGKANLVTLAQLGHLRTKNEAHFVRLGEKIKEGVIAPAPLFSQKKQHDACRYCPMLPICKRDPACRKPFRSDFSRKDLLGEEEDA